MRRRVGPARWLPSLLLAVGLQGCTVPPAYGPRTTELPADPVVLPARYTRGIFLLFVDLPGHDDQQMMLLDTGTDRTLLDLSVADALGLDAESSESIVTATGSLVQGSRLGRLPWLRIGAARFDDIDAVGVDLAALKEHGGLPIVGIVGCDLFRHCLLEIDYVGRAVRLQPRNRAPTGGHAFAERSPWVDIDVAGHPFRALVDSGFQQALALPPGTELPWRRAPRRDGEIAAIDGIAAKLAAQVQGPLRLGDLEWRNPWVALVPGAPKLGSYLLRNCVVLLDVAGGRIWIERRR